MTFTSARSCEDIDTIWEVYKCTKFDCSNYSQKEVFQEMQATFKCWILSLLSAGGLTVDPYKPGKRAVKELAQKETKALKMSDVTQTAAVSLTGP